ncbi:MAG: hypothetical protein R6U59_02835 [Eubacteriales bacterium]
MIILRIILIVIGLPFIYYGFNILFRKKYNYINNYESDKKIGKVDEAYAKRIGAVELIGGKLCVILGIIAMFLEDRYTLYFFLICIGGIVIFLALNQFFFRKKVEEK